MMLNILSSIDGCNSVAIAGHIRPDGDCIGACMALYHYIKGKHPHIKVTVFLDPFGEEYNVLPDMEVISHQYIDQIYDVFIAVDCADKNRLGIALPYLTSAIKTLNIDHHISNEGYGEENFILADASSTCEILYTLMDVKYMNQAVAKALYLGIIFDTGVFKHSNTSEETLKIAGHLISYGFNFSEMIDAVMFQKSFMQNKLLGRALLDSQVALAGKVIYSVLELDTIHTLNSDGSSTDGIIEQLRVTKGVECAFFMQEFEPALFKISLRANSVVDVCSVAKNFGGGGHVKAAGCTANGTKEEVIATIIKLVQKQL